MIFDHSMNDLPVRAPGLLRASLIPAAIATVGGIANIVHLASITGLPYLRPFGVRESESLMNFSPLGLLQCSCLGEDAGTPHPERRNSCRACGHELVEEIPLTLNKPLNRQEIVYLIAQLQRTAIRCRNLEIPAHIKTMEQLQDYIDDPEPKRRRKPPRRGKRSPALAGE